MRIFSRDERKVLRSRQILKSYLIATIYVLHPAIPGSSCTKVTRKQSHVISQLSNQVFSENLGKSIKNQSFIEPLNENFELKSSPKAIVIELAAMVTGSLGKSLDSSVDIPKRFIDDRREKIKADNAKLCSD